MRIDPRVLPGGEEELCGVFPSGKSTKEIGIPGSRLNCGVAQESLEVPIPIHLLCPKTFRTLGTDDSKKCPDKCCLPARPQHPCCNARHLNVFLARGFNRTSTHGIQAVRQFHRLCDPSEQSCLPKLGLSQPNPQDTFRRVSTVCQGIQTHHDVQSWLLPCHSLDRPASGRATRFQGG